MKEFAPNKTSSIISLKIINERVSLPKDMRVNQNYILQKKKTIFSVMTELSED